MLFFIPFLIGDEVTISGSVLNDPTQNTNLRWGCATTIDANPPSGGNITV